jgi:hypothetical protein
MKKLYAVVWQGKRTEPPICFPELEWAQQYRDYLHKRVPLMLRALCAISGTPTYTIMELDFCEHPPTLAMTGSDGQ